VPLTNGTARAEYLRLDGAEETAVADIRIHPGSAAEGRCTGVLVAERMVLTARHCTNGSFAATLLVAFGPDASGNTFESDAEVAAIHPSADVMILALNESPVGMIDVVPLPLVLELPSGIRRGSLVQLAGYGEDEHGELGQRMFLVETVRRITDDAFVVGGDGLSGACFGDSGGPLLMRANDGRAAVAGVLRRGSVSCFGEDSYTRVDPLAEWLAQADLPMAEPNARVDHAALGAAGRCFGELAVWVEAGELRARTCDGDRDCGWSSSAAGYRCVRSADDPCEGVSDVGVCEGDETAARCVRGRIERESCVSCGLRCVRSPTTGSPACFASAVRADGG
jgi:hypothetical protein